MKGALPTVTQIGQRVRSSRYRFWLRDVFHSARDRLLGTALPLSDTKHGLLRFVDEPTHSLENLITYSQRSKVQGPMRLNKMEVTDQTVSRYEFKVTNCIFKSVYERFGYPELLEVLCSVDNALYNTYAPDLITFTRGGARKTIARGNATCDFICTLSGPERNSDSCALGSS